MGATWQIVRVFHYVRMPIVAYDPFDFDERRIFWEGVLALMIAPIIVAVALCLIFNALLC